MSIEKICETCDNPFIANSGRAKYCNYCRESTYRVRPGTETEEDKDTLSGKRWDMRMANHYSAIPLVGG